MKTLVTCASIAAVGVAGVQAQGVSQPAPSKPWSIGAKVRGFYDDNYNTAPEYSTPSPTGSRAGWRDKRDSWGVNLNPYFTAALTQDLTTARLRYSYDMRWYEDRPSNDNMDHTHEVRFGLDHRFGPRYTVNVFDSFVVGQEAAVLGIPTAPTASPFRSGGDNVRNYAGAALMAQFCDTWGMKFAYENQLFDYEDEGAGSRSALLDRLEHKGTADFRYQLSPTSVGLIGYSFGYRDQTSSDLLAPGSTLTAEVRERQSHYGFVGLDHTFNPQMAINARAGFQYAEYPNAVAGMDDNDLVPYIDIMYQYLLNEDSKFQIGVKHGLYQIDVALRTVGDVAATQDSQSTTAYAAVTYDITEKLTGLVRGMMQFAELEGGAYDGQMDNFYTIDANLEYMFTPNFGAEVGYAYDRLDSDIGSRRYDRNRVYAGLHGKY